MAFDTVARDVSFFFQAEDGIRDVAVTGVQTCALPISRVVVLSDRRPSMSLFGPEWPWLRKPEAITECVRLIGNSAEIGRASCRERVEISVVVGPVQRKARELGRCDADGIRL